MTLYIDSAERNVVEPLLATRLFGGITTNPILLDRAGLSASDLPALYRWATAAGARTMFMQVSGTTVDELTARGRALRQLGAEVVVKVPSSRVGLQATAELTSEGIPVLVTAVYDASQALLASAAGAGFIAPYVGRMDDAGRSGFDATTTMRRILADGQCRVLAASLRSRDIVSSLAAAGVQDFAVPAMLCNDMLDDELTSKATSEFEVLARGHD